MNRRGAALFVALVVVLLAGMVTVLTVMTAIGEVRSGAAWSDQVGASALAASAAATGVEAMEAAFDSLGPGESAAISDTLLISRLSDSVGLVSARAVRGGGLEAVATVVRAWRDTAGGVRLRVPGSRVRFHPIP